MDQINIIILTCIIASALITLLYVFLLYRRVTKIKVENQDISNIGKYIRDGAIAFLKREFLVIIPFIAAIAVLLAVLGFIPYFQSADGVGWQSSICFAVGATFSSLAGFIGMIAATHANERTTSAAMNGGISSALHVAFSGGSILGLCVVGLGLLGLTGLFVLFIYVFIWIDPNIETITAVTRASSVITGYGLGCSMIALFGRVGGGIYTKAADVGADLVGKLESGIPEDDPRNPATIADNVGDNVGDIAGMASDLCESYVGSIISCITLAVIEISTRESKGYTTEFSWVIFPLLICACGALASCLSVMIIRAKKWKNPQRTLSVATYIASIIVCIFTVAFSLIYLKDESGVNPCPQAIGAVVAGLICGLLVGKIAEIYTSSDYKAVKEIARESETGHATNIISGLGVGMKSTGLTIVVIAIGIIASYFFLGDYGIALAAVGMLSTAGITISVDGYGPISDNAGGIAQMCHLDPNVREITDKLDSVGNTTAAIGKGFSIGSATLTSLALFLSYGETAQLFDSKGVASINMLAPEVIVGLLIGAMLPYFLTSLILNSVGKAANKMVVEVRRQFSNEPGILQGTVAPDYAKCVDISTKASLREMILPSVIAVVAPIATGFIIGKAGLGGLLVGGLTSSIMLAIFMANSGGAWDNAKKYIEEGHNGGKNSPAHFASITGDTVGDPLKDTAGPAMNILIKLMSMISLIIAPILVNTTSLWELITNSFNIG
jgi:K(+)-stimulated pyrophosphate-energized sodium pump